MTRVLTVEDSRAMRAVIHKALSPQGYVIDEAEDGEKGLAKLADGPVDLILLDVTMPVMDGPTMLKELRGRGDKTPVILLTAESKTSLIGEMMAAGVDDYILKPFKAEQLCAKVDKVLTARGVGAVDDDAPEEEATTFTGKPFMDILLIDDMENVAKRLRRLLPEHIKVNHCLDGQAAVNLCKERIYRTIVVDFEIPDVNVTTMVSQLKALQPNAGFVALLMRNAENKRGLAREMGCNGYVVKPFKADELDDFLATYFDSHEILSCEENVLQVSARAGRAANFEKNYPQLVKLAGKETEKIAAASYEAVILDLTHVQESPRILNLMIKAAEQAENMGVDLRVVMPDALKAALGSFKDTEDIPVFASVSEAQAAND